MDHHEHAHPHTRRIFGYCAVLFIRILNYLRYVEIIQTSSNVIGKRNKMIKKSQSHSKNLSHSIRICKQTVAVNGWERRKKTHNRLANVFYGKTVYFHRTTANGNVRKKAARETTRIIRAKWLSFSPFRNGIHSVDVICICHFRPKVSFSNRNYCIVKWLKWTQHNFPLLPAWSRTMTDAHLPTFPMPILRT